jgi:acyl-CoA thioester hydrolase
VSKDVIPSFQTSFRIYYEDTDAGGVVYYANYLRLAERARTEWLRALGFTHAELLADYGLVFVVRHAEADYRAPARLDDRITVTTEIAACGAATLDMHQLMRLEQPGSAARQADVGKTLVEIKVKLATLSADGKVLRLPPALRAAFGK